MFKSDNAKAGQAQGTGPKNPTKALSVVKLNFVKQKKTG
jgi:hypothetical protein